MGVRNQIFLGQRSFNPELNELEDLKKKTKQRDENIQSERAKATGKSGQTRQNTEGKEENHRRIEEHSQRYWTGGWEGEDDRGWACDDRSKRARTCH